MEKTLNILQVLAKIGKILSMIVFVCCCVGGGACLFSLLTVGSVGSALNILGVDIFGLIQVETGITYTQMLTEILTGAIACAGQAVVAKFAHVYFRRELEAGTPFTLAGAKELFRLGILSLAIPAGTYTLSAIVLAAAKAVSGESSVFSWGGGIPLSMGVALLVVSLLCRYGAELSQSGQPAMKEEELTRAEN